MFEYLKKVLIPEFEGNNNDSHSTREKKIQVATCALFIELAKADDDFSEVERKKIISLMEDIFDIDEEYVEELVALSESKVNQSVSVYEFTTVINNNFDRNEKIDLLINLWRLVYIDDTLNQYEDGLMRKLGTLLNLEHSDLINAKLLVKQEKTK